MPDGSKLGKAKLRGVESSGMILAEDEVGISDEHSRDDGARRRPDARRAARAAPADRRRGDRARDHPQPPRLPGGLRRRPRAARGDRRAAGAGPDRRGRTNRPATSDQRRNDVSIEIAHPEICLRFTGRVFEDVKVGPSPLWLKQRLTAAGQRPISNVVDITNYVMLLTGQPVHAFDLDEVRGNKIIVRRAEPGEKMTTLDGVERELDPDMAMVCDAEGPSGIAGIMGGQISEVSDKTTRVLMEMATWVGPNILETSKRLGLRSEASARFEKQLHPDQAIAAQRLAARLMVELCGARMVPGTIDVYPNPVAATERAAALGAPREAARRADPGGRVRCDPRRLGFDVPASADEMEVGVPGFRDADVQREADLIEEVARIYGLDKLPTTLPAREKAVGRLTPSQLLRRRIEDALRDRGLYEIVAWSFTSPEAIERLRLGDVPLLRLSNPLSEDQSVMRPLLLAGAPRHGAPQRCVRPRGRVVLRVGARLPDGGPARRPRGVAARRASGRRAASRGGAGAGRLLRGEGDPRRAARTRSGSRSRSSRASARSCTPGRQPACSRATSRRSAGSASCTRSSRARGISTAAPRSSSTRTRSPSSRRRAPGYRAVSTFPAVIQDIAVVVAEDVPAADVEEAVVREAAASCSSGCGCSTSTAASRSAPTASRSRCGSSSARPIAR